MSLAPHHAGGVEVKPGRTVYVTINSFRQKSVTVPYVAGRSLRQAKNMLEIAGLEIEELIYRPDMATNYVLEEYCDGRPVQATSRIEAEMGSGVTLYVGVEAGSETTPVPLVTGYGLREAKSRLWELGINVGRVNYDEGINLLNQKQARVYRQSPAAEQTVRLGDRVEVEGRALRVEALDGLRVARVYLSAPGGRGRRPGGTEAGVTARS